MIFKLIKPVNGVLIRLEDGSGYLPAEGQKLPYTGYWRRRVMDGDAVAEEPANADEASAAEPAAEAVTTPATAGTETKARGAAAKTEK